MSPSPPPPPRLPVPAAGPLIADGGKRKRRPTINQGEE
jgi:hypothetical protein